MAFLKRDQIKEIVKNSLLSIADFTGDIEGYEFKHLNELHKKVFVTKLKKLINEEPYRDRAGNIHMDQYYDVPLSMGLVNSWKTLPDCINYVRENQTVEEKVG